MPSTEIWQNEIANYEDTIHAMVGFANLYWYDDDARKPNPDVLVMQGRRFERECHPDPQITVTPDLAILVKRDKTGVVAEAKKSFPSDKTLWLADFEQIRKYDAVLLGWPNGLEPVEHDLALLTHISRSRMVADLFRDKKSAGEITYARRFCIIEFSRSDERDPYLFFRKEEGSLSNQAVDKKLHQGVPIPMEVLVTNYSMVKFYDSEPPLPYLLQIMWQEIVAPRADKVTPLEKMRAKQKVEVVIDLDEMVAELNDKFSFKALFRFHDERQPKVPRTRLVRQACDKLVLAKLAEWSNGERKEVRVWFQAFDDLLEKFIGICGSPKGQKQLQIFPGADLD